MSEIIGAPGVTRTHGTRIRNRYWVFKEINKLAKQLAQSVMTVYTVDPIFLISSGKIVGEKG